MNIDFLTAASPLGARARQLRSEFPSACSHVFTRGNHCQVIFHDAADREPYPERLEHYRRRYSLRLYAYVLMANHVHSGGCLSPAEAACPLY